MSKPYRIRLQETVTVADHSTFHIDPVPLVTQQGFEEIMQHTLQELGWKADAEGRLSIAVDDKETWTYLPDKMQIVTSIESQHQINQNIESWSPDVLEQEAARVKEERERELQQQATAALEAGQEDRRRQLETIVAEATGRAIKQAAERLGDIQEINESRGEKGQYTLSITIHERE